MARRSLRACWTVFVALAVSTAVASSVRAQSTAGRVRLGASLPVLSVEALRSELSPVENTTTITAGPGLRLPLFDIGYGLDSRLALGARFAFGSSTVLYRDSTFTTRSASLSSLELEPYLEIHVAGRSALQPFVGPLLIMRASAANGGDGDVAYRQGALGLGACLGLRAFIGDRFAFEPSVLASYAVGRARAQDDMGKGQSGDTRELRIVLALSASFWAGGPASPDAQRFPSAEPRVRPPAISPEGPSAPAESDPALPVPEPDDAEPSEDESPAPASDEPEPEPTTAPAEPGPAERPGPVPEDLPTSPDPSARGGA